MPIRFPRMHIAESVSNRILNLAEELAAGGLPTLAGGVASRAFQPPPEDRSGSSDPEGPPPSSPAAPTGPVPPNTAAQGAALDARLASPAPPMPPAEPPESDPQAALQGLGSPSGSMYRGLFWGGGPAQ